MTMSVAPLGSAWFLTSASSDTSIDIRRALALLAVPLVLYMVTSQRSASEDFCGQRLGRFKGLTLVRLSPICCMFDILLDGASMIRSSVEERAAPTEAPPFVRDLNGLIEKLDEGTDEDTSDPGAPRGSRRDICFALLAGCCLAEHSDLGAMNAVFKIYIIAIIAHVAHTPRTRQGSSKLLTTDTITKLLILVQFVQYGALWMAAEQRWAVQIIRGYECRLARVGVAIILLHLLFLLVILIAAYISSWRASSTVLMVTQLIFGFVMFLNADGATFWPFSFEFVTGGNLFGSTAAMLLPLLVSSGSAIAAVRFWRRPASIFKSHGDVNKEPFFLPATLETNEFLRVFLDGMTTFPAAITICEWLSDLLPEIQQLSFLIFNLLTAVACLV